MSMSLPVFFLALALTVFGQEDFSRPGIARESGNVQFRHPRNGDVKFSREVSQNISISGFSDDLEDMELWKSTAVDEIVSSTLQSSKETSESVIQTSYQAFDMTVGKRIPTIASKAAEFNNKTQAHFNAKRTDIQRRFDAAIADRQALLNDVIAQYTAELDAKLQEYTEIINSKVQGIETFSNNASKTISSVQSGAFNDGKPLWDGASNWCFSWGNGRDYYNSGWTDYGTGMKDCVIQSKSGWVKWVLDVRIYGQNHGGVRIRSTDNSNLVFGRDGTYGFQWMTTQHHGHRWTPLTLVRYVQIPKNKRIPFRMQIRSQCNGCRLTFHGGTYSQQYAGVWMYMQEMADPMSKP